MGSRWPSNQKCRSSRQRLDRLGLLASSSLQGVSGRGSFVSLGIVLWCARLLLTISGIVVRGQVLWRRNVVLGAVPCTGTR